VKSGILTLLLKTKCNSTPQVKSKENGGTQTNVQPMALLTHRVKLNDTGTLHNGRTIVNAYSWLTPGPCHTCQKIAVTGNSFFCFAGRAVEDAYSTIADRNRQEL
jgi:hypothetical protein